MPASPTCSSPASVASIYGTHARGGVGSGGSAASVSNYHPPQYHHATSAVGTNGNASGTGAVGAHYMNSSTSTLAHQQSSERAFFACFNCLVRVSLIFVWKSLLFFDQPASFSKFFDFFCFP